VDQQSQTSASVVGVLFMKAHLLCQEAENENPPENKHHA
jgi:hypothetical protein